MSTTAVHPSDAATDPRVGKVDMKLEVVILPVSDVERARKFYGGLGWRLDADFARDGERIIQFTPPGSQCSVHFGTNYTSAAPGSAQNFLVVSDLEAARKELAARGVTVSETFHFAGLNRRDPAGRVGGRSPDFPSYGSFLSFTDPDGNGWLVQEITTRLPGRVAGDTSYASVNDVRQALWRAAIAHGEHEKRTGGHDENWPDWYAAYMVAEAAGTELPI